MPSIYRAVQWAIRIANDDSHGYDQANRYGPDYDCSSFVAAALIEGGFNVSPYMYTGNEYSELTAAGFAPVHPIGAEIQAGDVFFYHHEGNNGHTCIAINSSQIAQATCNEFGGATGGMPGDQTGTEIEITNYGGAWDYQMRYGAEALRVPVWLLFKFVKKRRMLDGRSL